MPLTPVPHQPLAFANLKPVDNCDCNDTMPYLLEEDDIIYGQFTQTPCGDNLICDGNFNGVTGTAEQIGDTDFTQLSGELMSNSAFTGNANGWSLAQFSYTTNAVEKTNNAAFGGVSQGFGSLLVANAMYRIRVVVLSDGGSGNLRIRMVSTNPLTNINSSTFGGAGTFDIYMKASATIQSISLIASSDWTGEIDSISVRRIAALWEFGEDITMGENSGIVTTQGSITQPLIYNGVLQPNTPYQVQVEFNGTGAASVMLGNNLGTYQNITGNQTKTWLLSTDASGSFKLLFDTGYDGEILSVSVQNINSTCWEVEEDAGWSLSQNAICKTAGSGGLITNSATIDAGLYEGYVEIAGATQGTLTITLDGINREVSGSGRHVFYYDTQNASQLTIYADAQFNGCIIAAGIYLLKTDYVFTLIRESGTEVADISSYVSYYEKYVTLKFRLSDIDAGDLLNDESISFGCYRIRVYDTCELQYRQIWNDISADNPVGVWWGQVSSPPEISLSISGGNMIVQATSPASNIFYYIKNYIIPNGVSQDFTEAIPAGSHNYRAEFEIISNSDESNITVGVYAGGTFGSNGGSAPGLYSITINEYDPEFIDPPRHFIWLLVRFMNGTTGTVILDNFKLNRIEPYTASYESRIISYKEKHTCTHLIRSWAEKEAYGFEFVNTGFYLQQRIPVKVLAAEYQQTASRYLHSSGVRTTMAGQTEKQWLLIVDYSPEEVHDAMAIQKVLQHFEIENDNGFISYTPEGGDYTPEWNLKVSTLTAPARFKITKTDGTKFMKI